jgi:hypothetical protein
MSFYVWTCIGIAVGVVQLLLPGEHRLGAASSITLGVGGAINGALVAQAFVRGGWIAFGPLGLAGAVAGAAGAIALVELAARVYLRLEQPTGRQSA